MDFRDFRAQIKDLQAFNLNDIRKIDPNFYKPQLTYWVEKGFVKAVAGGIYVLGDKAVDSVLLYMIANKISLPSYVSLESALSYYQIIPERVYGVTSVTSKKTKEFLSDWGSFSYRSVKPSYMFGYEIIVVGENRKFLMATLEKTVLDFLYLNTKINSVEDFVGLRWDKAKLSFLKDSPVLQNYLMKFQKSSLGKRLKILMRYLNV